jgi:hypothetical protein
MHPRFLLLCIFCACAPLLLADKSAGLQPLLNKPGKLVVDEQFTGSSLGGSWGAVQGDWQLRDGAVIGREKASDDHAAVLFLGRTHRDAILRFSFQLDGVKGFHLSLNHLHGHLFRISVDGGGLSLSKEKDKKNPQSKSETLAKVDGKFKTGTWHTLLVETRGGKVSVQADNGAKLSTDNAALDMEKTGYRFVTRGQSLRIADVKVWEISPDAAK